LFANLKSIIFPANQTNKHNNNKSINHTHCARCMAYFPSFLYFHCHFICKSKDV